MYKIVVCYYLKIIEYFIHTQSVDKNLIDAHISTTRFNKCLIQTYGF